MWLSRAPSATPNPNETLANVPATDTPRAQAANTRLPECPTPPGYQVRMSDTFPNDFPFSSGANDVPLPLRKAAVYVLTELPKRGYTFVRGLVESNCAEI